MTPEFAPPSFNYHTNRRALSLDRFNVHRLPLYGGFSEAPGLELETHRSRVRDLNHSATAATNKCVKKVQQLLFSRTSFNCARHSPADKHVQLLYKANNMSPDLSLIEHIWDGLVSNPGEDMDVCKCIVPSRHGGTLKSRRAASPLVRLMEWEERWEVPDHPQDVLPQNWGETELNRFVTPAAIAKKSWSWTGQCPPVGAVWKFEAEGASSAIVLVT
ncbi:uncharacterized protein TNCV_1304421 [Trichonephila clavipes]|nr:uncharacterized protein TNCV_1304421 [Trichonephila clavipes]